MSQESNDIIMYARERFCPDVARSRARLTEHGLDWTEYDVESNDAAAAETERLTGRRSVPTLVIGTSILVEPSNDELDSALVDAGYDINQ
jgi:glutaredoxin